MQRQFCQQGLAKICKSLLAKGPIGIRLSRELKTLELVRGKRCSLVLWLFNETSAFGLVDGVVCVCAYK